MKAKYGIFCKLIALVWCWIAGAGMASGQSPEYLEMVDSAQVAVAQDRLDDAELFLQKAMVIEPSSPANVMLLSNLGLIQYRNGRPEQALATLDDAHRIAPRAVVVLANRADVYGALGRDEEAYADYSAILAIDSINAKALFNRGMLALAKDSVEVARRDFATMQRHYPASRDTRQAMASLTYSQHLYLDAIHWLTELIEKDVPEAIYYHNRAFCYLMNERLTEASADIAKGMEMDPENPDFYELRALLNKMSYSNDAAERDLRRAKELRK